MPAQLHDYYPVQTRLDVWPTGTTHVRLSALGEIVAVIGGPSRHVIAIIPDEETDMPGGGEGVLGSLPSLEDVEAYVAQPGGGTSEPLGTLPTLADIEAYCDEPTTDPT
jgi:hypothetical protein